MVKKFYCKVEKVREKLMIVYEFYPVCIVVNDHRSLDPFL